VYYNYYLIKLVEYFSLFFEICYFLNQQIFKIKTEDYKKIKLNIEKFFLYISAVCFLRI